MNIQTAQELGNYHRSVRKSVGLTQKQLAAAGGVGVRFIIELENGKPTCELGRALHVLSLLGVSVNLQAPQVEPIAAPRGGRS